MSFWQVQDKVPAEYIRRFTDLCDREDCCVSFRMGETQLGGTSDYYDKNGNLHIHNRNNFVGDLCCKTCWCKGEVLWTGDVIITQEPKA